MRITTKRRLSGSGPRNDVKMPGVGSPPGIIAGPGMRARPSIAAASPPLDASTAQITAAMPTSITRPWMKSLMAVAM